MCKETVVAILEVLSQIQLKEGRIPGKFSIRVASFQTGDIILQHCKYKQECPSFNWNIQWTMPQNFKSIIQKTKFHFM
jgi:hypothetical protein